MNQVAVVALCAFTLVGASSLYAQGTAADYERSAGLRALTADKVFRDRVEPNWLADGKTFWYRVRTGVASHEFVLVDAEQGTRTAAFDHTRLAAALKAQGFDGVQAERLELVGLAFSPVDQTITFQRGDKTWKCSLRDYALNEIPADQANPAAQSNAPVVQSNETSITFVNKTAALVEIFWQSDAEHAVKYGAIEPGAHRRQHTFAGHEWVVRDAEGKTLQLARGRRRESVVEIDGKAATDDGERRRPSRPAGDERGSVSPDRKWRASVRDDNVVLESLETNDEFALSTDGRAEDAYDGRFFWSPDSKRLVALHTQPAEERKVTIVQSSPRDQLQPKTITFDYLKPGDRVAVTKPSLFDVEARSQIAVSDELFANPFSTGDFRWEPDGRRFSFLFNERGHQALRIVAVDGETGKVSTIVNETSETFIDYTRKTFVRRLDATNELVWMSERDGWNHLYLYDAATGEVKNQITRGAWVVRAVDRVDAEQRQIWFQLSGYYPEQDPYYIHFARVNFDGSGLTLLTEGNGTHQLTYSPDRRFAVDRWSRVDHPPTTELRRVEDAKRVCVLEEADWSELQKTGWRTPEPFVAKGRDGEMDIHGVIVRPTNFDPAKSYPVIEQIYAGPHDSFVPKAFSPYLNHQAMAELGFIVVQIDGMGTSNRSKRFHDVCWKNLGDSGFPDRMLWMQAAAAKYPYMDLTRVGIYGGSAGGQSSTRALLAHGDFYKAAVSDCGCHDNRMDKIWWNEQWMGWPVGPHYAEQSNVTQAHRLTGKLMLVVGELDQNVDPASTMQVANALVKADKDFDLLIIPGAGHGACETPYGQRRRQDFFVRHLLSVEPRRQP